VSTTIRLTRMGRKKRPFYRLVVLDSRKRRDGAYLANLGYYNPFCDPAEVDLRPAEIIDWLSKGATMSETARSLLRNEGVLYRYSLVKQGLEDSEIESRMAQWTADAQKKIENREAALEAKKAAKAKAEAEAEAAAKAEAEAAEAAAKAEAEAAAAAEAAAKAEAEAAEAAAKAEAEAAEAAAAAENAEAAAAEEAPAEEAAEPAAEEADGEEEK
jgi:small subunit ribosomal protein S16